MEMFSSNVKQLRESVGIRQIDLANDIGVCRKTINIIENESCSPSLAVAYRLAKYFVKTIEEVFESLE